MDLQRSLQFYQKVLGLRILQQGPQEVTLTANGETPLLTLIQPENVLPKQRRTTGLYHFALLLPSRKDLGILLKHFGDLRYPLQGAADHAFSEAVYLADPDGNGIEVYADTPTATWQWQQGHLPAITRPMDADGVIAEAGDATFEYLPAKTVMGHIHLHGAELTKIREFYVSGLGLDVITDIPGQALFLASGQYHHHIAVNVWNGVGVPEPAAHSVGLQSYELVFPNAEKRQAAVDNLQQLGYLVDQEAHTVKDPSGNQLILSI